MKKKMADRGKVAGYLASRRQRLEDLPRYVLTTAGVAAGAYAGFVVLPKSYFHTYLILASVGGALGFIAYELGHKAFEPLIKRWAKEAEGQATKERQDRIFPLSPQERMVAVPKVLLDRRIIPAVLATLVCIVAIGFWAYQAVPPRIIDVKDLSPKDFDVTARGRDRRLIFGVPREKAQKDLVEVSRLAPYLSKRTGMRVTLASAETYGSVAEGVEKGQLDAAILPAGSYLALRKRTKKDSAILQGVQNGATTYASVILARDSSIKGLKDLAGRTVALTSIDSLSGFTVPLFALRKEGVGMSDLGRIVLAGDHSSALRLFAGGDVEAVATFEANANLFLREHRDAGAHVVTRLGGIPNDVLVVRDGLSPKDLSELVQATRQVFSDPEAEDVADAFRELGVAGFQDVDRASLEAARVWLDEPQPGH